MTTTTRKSPRSVTADAERRIPITMEDARRVGGILGRILAAKLERCGWYAVTVDGVKTLYTLEGWPMTRHYYAIAADGAGRFQVLLVTVANGRTQQEPAEGVAPCRTQREAEEVMASLNAPIFARFAAEANAVVLAEG